MKVITNFESIQATSGEFDRPKSGGYIIRILNAVDVPLNAEGKGDYLKLDYDIDEGEFRGYYTDLNNKFGGEYKINFIRSYKDKALGMFKHFIECLEASNRGFKWSWDEKMLRGLRLGVVLQEEEYQKQDGSVGTRLKVKDIKTVQQIVDGDFKTPEVKKWEGSTTISQAIEELAKDDWVPF